MTICETSKSECLCPQKKKSTEVGSVCVKVCATILDPTDSLNKDFDRVFFFATIITHSSVDLSVEFLMDDLNDLFSRRLHEEFL